MKGGGGRAITKCAGPYTACIVRLTGYDPPRPESASYALELLATEVCDITMN